jgi:hypothetical protein
MKQSINPQLVHGPRAVFQKKNGSWPVRSHLDKARGGIDGLIGTAYTVTVNRIAWMKQSFGPQLMHGPRAVFRKYGSWPVRSHLDNTMGGIGISGWWGNHLVVLTVV